MPTTAKAGPLPVRLPDLLSVSEVWRGATYILRSRLSAGEDNPKLRKSNHTGILYRTWGLALKQMNEHGELPRFASGTGDFDAVFGQVYGDLQKGLKRSWSFSTGKNFLDFDELLSEAVVRMKTAFNAGVTDPQSLLREGINGGNTYVRAEERERARSVSLGFDVEHDAGPPLSHMAHRGPRSRSEQEYLAREKEVFAELESACIRPGSAEFEAAYAEAMVPTPQAQAPRAAPSPGVRTSQFAPVSMPASVPTALTTSTAPAALFHLADAQA